MPSTPSPSGPAGPPADEPGREPAVRAPSPPDLLNRPSALGLARLSQGQAFPPGGEALYRHLIRLVEPEPGQELLVVPSGPGTVAQFLSDATGLPVSGVDPDRELVAGAVERAKLAGAAGRLHFEQAPLTDLPYQDEVFDVVLGEIGIGAVEDPAAAVRELVRTVRTMGTVVLVQLTWTQQVDGERRAVLIEHLGVRPFLLVEWKQMLREAGVVDLYVEDWSHAVASAHTLSAAGVLEQFSSLPDKIRILYRGWRRWGLAGVRELLAREQEMRRLVRKERVLGLTVIRGTRWHGVPDDAGDGGETHIRQEEGRGRDEDRE
jgi:ubiquinone/menaquinone biosynthesis C-methylase UbiE